MKSFFTSLALSALLGIPFTARADDVLLAPAGGFDAQTTRPPGASSGDGLAQRGYDGYRPYRREVEARQGLLLSFGLGGGSMYLSPVGPGRSGAFDLDFRIGYGFSDRFQMFMDIGVDAGRPAGGNFSGVDLTSWTATLRGQTVLVGDRAGNGLNLNFGIGLGGVTYNSGYYNESSSAAGLALAGGLSYDARVSPYFALSPEFFLTWHEIPNGVGVPNDVASVYGLRLNFLWYLH